MIAIEIGYQICFSFGFGQTSMIYAFIGWLTTKCSSVAFFTLCTVNACWYFLDNLLKEKWEIVIVISCQNTYTCLILLEKICKFVEYLLLEVLGHYMPLLLAPVEGLGPSSPIGGLWLTALELKVITILILSYYCPPNTN